MAADDVNPADVEFDRELFCRIAETHPGIVRTLGVLIGELTELDLDPDAASRLGDRLRRLGDTVIKRFGHVTIDHERGPLPGPGQTSP